MIRKLLFLYISLLLPVTALFAQDWSARPWPADWITHPSAPATEFAVVNFRRTFELTALPDSLPVMVSADNRYQIFVNGTRVGEGPARGDLQHWRYETYDLRPYLREGKNVVAAIVWNYGIDKPWSQQSYQTAFVLQPKTEAFAELKTDRNWKSFHNLAYSPITGSRERLGTYIVTGPQLRIDGNLLPWSYSYPIDQEEDWLAAKPITKASPAGVGTEYYWGLVPREIPPLVRDKLGQPQIVYPDGERQKFNAAIFNPNVKTKILLDYGRVENMFITIGITGGEDAEIKITYAESLFHEDGTKGDRDSIAGKEIKGVCDIIIPSYNKSQPAINSRLAYSTLWFRTARYVELEITAGPTGLTIADIVAESFAYPFEEKASFTSPDLTLRTDEIWNVAWQTARMCAQETYVDCPYYEQLQYVGDTRIQALISLYVSGDDRLMRKAIKLFDQSRTSEGLTQSRYPSSVPQIIPPYSLSWIGMVGDYWMHRPDSAFVRAMLPGVRAVLDWYDGQLLKNGLVGPTPHWNFVDWTDDWPWNNELRTGGVPDLKGGSSIISLQLLGALRTAEGMSRYFDDDHQAGIYKDRADRVFAAVLKHCWKADRGLFSDTPAGTSFSQHANILALSTDLAPATAPTTEGSSAAKALKEHQNRKYEANHELLLRILEDESLTQVSEYFRFYLIQAMFHVGDGHLYADQLKVWAAYLDQGLTTFPEKPGETRSDCHAWSASPNYDLLAIFAGIRPGSPGFKTVEIRPSQQPFTARVAHPDGLITVKSYGGESDGWDIKWRYEVTLPPGITGRIQGVGGYQSLQPGSNTVEFVMMGY